MRHELWDDPADEGRYTFCLRGPLGDDARSKLSPAARLIWTVDASSHFEAMTLYYEHQGWGVYTTDQGWAFTSYRELGWSSERPRPSGAESQAALLTSNLRRSDNLLFVVLRKCLADAGFDTETVVLAQLFPDGDGEEFGVLMTTERRVFTFVLHRDPQGDPEGPMAAARLSRLTDITDRWEASAYRRYVEEALTLEGWDG
jgi:hypothetical protein